MVWLWGASANPAEPIEPAGDSVARRGKQKQKAKEWKDRQLDGSRRGSVWGVGATTGGQPRMLCAVAAEAITPVVGATLTKKNTQKKQICPTKLDYVY